MCIVEDPAQSPARWKRIPRHRLSARSSRKEEMFPVGYFVLLMDGRTALAIPGRGGRLVGAATEEADRESGIDPERHWDSEQGDGMTNRNNPIIQELAPSGPWLVDMLDGLGDRTVKCESGP